MHVRAEVVEPGHLDAARRAHTSHGVAMSGMQHGRGRLD